jgi:hypothetical protein
VPVEAWETRPVLGFKRGVYWIGGMRAGHGDFLLRYCYVVIPYWFCGVAVLTALAGVTAHVRRDARKRARRHSEVTSVNNCRHSGSGLPLVSGRNTSSTAPSR